MDELEELEPDDVLATVAVLANAGSCPEAICT